MTEPNRTQSNNLHRLACFLATIWRVKARHPIWDFCGRCAFSSPFLVHMSYWQSAGSADYYQHPSTRDSSGVHRIAGMFGSKYEKLWKVVIKILDITGYLSFLGQPTKNPGHLNPAAPRLLLAVEARPNASAVQSRSPWESRCQAQRRPRSTAMGSGALQGGPWGLSFNSFNSPG